MRNYETIVVLSPELSEGKAKEELNNIKNIIQTNAGTDLKDEFWGKREIAHKIGKYKHGFYCSIKFSANNPGLVAELTRIYRISDNVIKYQTYQISTKKRKFKGKNTPVVKEASETSAQVYLQ